MAPGLGRSWLDELANGAEVIILSKIKTRRGLWRIRKAQHCALPPKELGCLCILSARPSWKGYEDCKHVVRSRRRKTLQCRKLTGWMKQPLRRSSFYESIFKTCPAEVGEASVKVCRIQYPEKELQHHKARKAKIFHGGWPWVLEDDS